MVNAIIYKDKSKLKRQSKQHKYPLKWVYFCSTNDRNGEFEWLKVGCSVSDEWEPVKRERNRMCPKAKIKGFARSALFSRANIKRKSLQPCLSNAYELCLVYTKKGRIHWLRKNHLDWIHSNNSNCMCLFLFFYFYIIFFVHVSLCLWLIYEIRHMICKW